MCSCVCFSASVSVSHLGWLKWLSLILSFYVPFPLKLIIRTCIISSSTAIATEYMVICFVIWYLNNFLKF